MSEAELTRDHERIRAWAEERGGRPSVVADTRGGRPGAMLRFDFGKKDESLDEVSWSQFFKIFDDNNLALLLQEKTKTGRTSRFNKFVDADEHGLAAPPKRARTARSGKGAAPTAAAASNATSGAAGSGGRARPSRAGAGKGETRTKAPADRAAKPARAQQAADGGTDAVVTRDHEAIRAWAEKRGGRPALVEPTRGKRSGGLLRLDFGAPDENLKEVSWDEFFAVFDKSGVGFLHQDQTKSGRLSRFNKFVDQPASGGAAASGAAAKSTGRTGRATPAAGKAASSASGAKASTKAVPASGRTAASKTAPTKAARGKTATGKTASTKAAPGKAATGKTTSARAATGKTAPEKANSSKATTAKAPTARTASAKPAKSGKPAAAKSEAGRAARSGGAGAKAKAAQANDNAPPAGRKAAARPDTRADAAAGKARTREASGEKDAEVTTDHARIREWVEARGGRPTHVADTARRKGELGILRIDFGKPDEGLEEVPWPKFLKAFDKNRLAFLFKEKTANGRVSRFNKFVDRED